jgi:hypothetical protein
LADVDEPACAGELGAKLADIEITVPICPALVRETQYLIHHRHKNELIRLIYIMLVLIAALGLSRQQECRDHPDSAAKVIRSMIFSLLRY